MQTKISSVERLEEYIISFLDEKDSKKKHVYYLRVVDECLMLVKRIVSGMYPYPVGVCADDLTQVGALGALKAIDIYKPSNKGCFKNYVTKFIKGRILQYLRDKTNLVKTPRYVAENINKVRDYIDTLGSKEIPPSKIIAKELNLPLDIVEDILNLDNYKNIVSLDQNIYTYEGTETLADRIQCDDNESQRFENIKILEYALNKLDKSEKIVIYKYYIEGLTQKDISKILGVSPMQVGRIIKRVLNKMYVILEKELFDSSNE